jgi:hypothetical protein
MNTLQQKIEYICSDVDVLGGQYSYIDIQKGMQDIARFVFNELYLHEASNEVEPWGTKEQQEAQINFSNGWNEYRKRNRDKAVELGIIKK